jgi:hypothetical protein
MIRTCRQISEPVPISRSFGQTAHDAGMAQSIGACLDNAAASPAQADRASTPPARAGSTAAHPPPPPVLRLIPNRAAISRCETPSAANALT